MNVEKAPDMDAVRRAAIDAAPTLFRYGSRRDSVEVRPAECAKIVAKHAASTDVQRSKIERMVRGGRSDFLKCLDFCSGRAEAKHPAPEETALGAALKKARR